MSIKASVELPFATKDPREAISECIKLIRKNAGFPAQVEIDLGLVCASNRGVLVRLAERLPATALGFCSSGSDRAITAGQFQKQADTGFCTFNGKLTDHLLPMDALRLIEELFESPAQAIRSTAFDLGVQNLQWNGAPSDGTGSLHLSDFKAFKRKNRFSLSASLQISGNDPAAPEVKEVLKRVSEAAGIAFEKGHIVRAFDKKNHSPEYGEAVLVAKICFDEAVENVAGKLSGRWISEFAPSALSRGEALEQRFKQRFEGGSSKVNLPSIIKAAIKEFAPELRSYSTEWGDISFYKRIGESLEIIAVFSNALPKIGKAFTASIGVRNVKENMCFDTNVFEFERTSEHKTWTYENADEARAMASEAANLLKALLPYFESSIKSYFSAWPKELPAGIEQHGNLTARQAFEIALPLARNLFSDAVLIRVHNFIRSLQTRDIEGPELSVDGRLRKNGGWWLHFYSKDRDVSFEITVPFVGRIRVQDHGKQYQNENSQRYLVPVGEEWIDSDRAFALAEERGGKDRRESGKMFGISIKLQMHPSQQPYWAIMYLVFDERGRNDLIVNLDAVTGEQLDNIRGF